MKKKILIVNNGSTSVKFSLFDIKGNLLEKKEFKSEEKKEKKEWLSKIEDLEKIGFRIVHGGDLTGVQELNKKILKKIEEFKIFAPIHNSLVLNEVVEMRRIFAKQKFFGYFDTAFHQSISKEIFTYAIKPEIAKKYKIRKYGFHGIAVESALSKIEKLYKSEKVKLPKKIIFAHLGGGSSITAVKNKKSVATTMELTPISGLMMTTRVGNVDSDLDKILVQKMKKNIYEISDILNYESGFYGLTGTKDIKKIFDEWKKNKNSKYGLAVEIFLNQIIERISGFIGLLEGIDLIVFSGGIGFKNKYLAKEVIKRLEKTFGKIDYLRVEVDEAEVIFEKIRKK